MTILCTSAGVRLLASLRDREATELVFGTDEQSDDASDPMPKGAVEGRDLLNAARDGYVFRTQSDGQVTVLKREKSLYLRIRPDYVNSPEMQEVERIFRLTPGLAKYRIKSELSDEANRELPNPLGSDTIYMNLRSVLQIMTFLSKGVCIPEEHIDLGGRADDAGARRPALRLDAGHGRAFHRPRPETPAPRCRDRRALSRILVLCRPGRCELAGGPIHPRDRVRPARIRRPKRRPTAHPADRGQVTRLTHRTARFAIIARRPILIRSRQRCRPDNFSTPCVNRGCRRKTRRALE